VVVRRVRRGVRLGTAPWSGAEPRQHATRDLNSAGTTPDITGGAPPGGLWVVVSGGDAGRPGPGRVSEAVRGPSVRTSGDDGLARDQGAVTGVRGLALLRSATWGWRTYGAAGPA
jgi:hypothetical protein